MWVTRQFIVLTVTRLLQERNYFLANIYSDQFLFILPFSVKKIREMRKADFNT